MLSEASHPKAGQIGLSSVTNLALASGLQGLRHVMLGAQLCI
jgi:hypothetical protein